MAVKRRSVRGKKKKIKRTSKGATKINIIVPNVKKKTKGGLYKPPKHRDLSRIVTFESVEGAKKAAKELDELFHSARTRKRKLTILKATNYAATRARVTAKRNPLFKPPTRRKWLKIASIYERAAEKMDKEYKKRFGRR